MPVFSDDDPAIRLEFEAVSPGSPASAVARQLLQLLTDGAFVPGTRLPPERSLAESLGVGRSAVREALAALEILGVVQIRAGSGTYLQGTASELLPKTLSWGLLLAQTRTQELLEIRASLERTASALCAERVSEAEVERLRGYVDEMQKNTSEPEAFIEADVRFHAAIAAIAGNEVLADLLQIVRSLLRVWADRGVRTSEQAEAAFREHTTVLDALAAHDPHAAEQAMAAHMTTASERVSAAAQGAASEGGAELTA